MRGGAAPGANRLVIIHINEPIGTTGAWIRCVSACCLVVASQKNDHGWFVYATVTKVLTGGILVRYARVRLEARVAAVT